eukprot:m.58465 g.58465  ORF g.58465 m.58465 type:complete len:78 (-) comp15653_c0_seq1:40-273(-)
MQNNPAPSPSRSARNASSEAAKDGFPVHEKSAMVTPTSSVMVPTYGGTLVIAVLRLLMNQSVLGSEPCQCTRPPNSA